MKRKFLRMILIVLGILSFLLVNRAIYLGDIDDPAWFSTCLIAIALLVVVYIGMFLYNYSGSSKPLSSERERNRRKRLGLVVY